MPIRQGIRRDLLSATSSPGLERETELRLEESAHKQFARNRSPAEFERLAWYAMRPRMSGNIAPFDANRKKGEGLRSVHRGAQPVSCSALPIIGSVRRH
jgi:hypothetical protein